MRDRDRYLKIIGERFYYVRRVPISMSTLDRRGTVKLSLKTKIPSEAREKRDQLEEVDDLYWSSLFSDNSASAHERYKSALDRAVFNGFTYRPAEELAATAPTPDSRRLTR